MTVNSLHSRGCALSLLLIVGCGTGADTSKERLESMSGGKLKTVVPVSGKVLVDGEPAGGVTLFLHPEKGGKPLAQTLTKPDGTYCWATYIACDGIEPGSYRLAFQRLPKQKRNDNVNAAEDLFKKKFIDPLKIDYPLTVAEGSPQVDVNYELSTK